jgi:hypothetical protein
MGIPRSLSSAAIVRHSEDHVAFLVPFFDIPVGLGNLSQRIASIYDRSHLLLLDELSQEHQVCGLGARWRLFLSYGTSQPCQARLIGGQGQGADPRGSCAVGSALPKSQPFAIARAPTVLSRI